MKVQLHTRSFPDVQWLHNMNACFTKYTYCIFICLFSIYSSFSLPQATEEIDTLDLRHIFIEGNTEISLESGWAFYWKQLITPEEFTSKIPFTKVSLESWTKFNLPDSTKLPSFGYATYRLKFSISKYRPHISLSIPAAFGSSKTWINGELISEIGRVGTTRATTLHRRTSQLIPLSTNETNFDIVIQVANFYHTKGGIDKPLIIGSSYHLQNLKSKRIIADMIFIGCLGFIGMFFLLFFLFYWNKDKAILYFGLLCISLSYMAVSDRYAPFAEIFPNVSWILLTRIEYVTLFLAGASASLFFCTIFDYFKSDMYAKVATLVFGLLSLLVIFLPAPYFTKFVIPFLLSMIINLIFVTVVIIKAIIRKHYESILLLVSMLLGSAVFYIHIFVFLGKNGNAIIYVNFAYIIVFMLLSMLLMRRFSNSFRQLENAKELALEQGAEISEKSEELSQMNTELTENLRQLESYNAELDSFNHIVSHDLKAPLVAMHTLISFIEEDLQDALYDDAIKHFNFLKERITKMNALINGLLEYSKVAKGHKNKEEFSLHYLLNEVIELINLKSDVTVNLPDNDVALYTNKIELEHVFQNLISNSIKYSDKEQTIIDITVTELSNEYVFAVSDNGPGIDPKYHTKIFEMFSQLNANKNEVDSTGIGLTIVKKIVSENHGNISVESEKGVGTKIIFSWKKTVKET
ncbi:ATP-binding protein [Tenacibaculum amylolyticum]|uniref:ATP-binding protein n=1 Tax=Tenacibaculum amylolyticum TaxID=104269 RepID=UPI0038B5FA7E